MSKREKLEQLLEDGRFASMAEKRRLEEHLKVLKKKEHEEWQQSLARQAYIQSEWDAWEERHGDPDARHDDYDRE